MSTVLSVEGLKKHYHVRSEGLSFFPSKQTLKAVDGVTFSIARGESLGIVGESGCGKSSLAKCLMALQPISAGRLELFGQDISSLSRRDLLRLRARFQMIFQDPYSSLNPRRTIYQTLVEPLVLHGIANTRAEIDTEVKALVERVGLSKRALIKYPHEFSGGQRQRIAIARAIAPRPDLLVCDEPVSALDVSIQAQILNLLRHLQKSMNLAMIFIAHDLSVVRYACERVAVMYLGKVVEMGPRDTIFKNPAHPYTRALMAALPIPDPRLEAARKKVLIKGDLPSPLNPPSGCAFRTRCPQAFDRCSLETPHLRDLDKNHQAACHLKGPHHSK